MFHSARLKLTGWYVLIILIICTMFSAAIYRYLSAEVDRFALNQLRRYEKNMQDRMRYWNAPSDSLDSPLLLLDPELIADVKNRLLLVLLLINAGIIVVTGGAGYLLAGITLRPIKDMLDEQKRFISDSSHELKTPLTALKTSLEVALRDKKITLLSAKQLLSESVEEVNKLQTLSESLLQLAQYDGSAYFRSFMNFRIQDCIESAVKRVRILAKEKSISIKSTSEPAQIAGDFSGIRDVIVILLDNAIKYSASKKTIVLTGVQKDHVYEITVKDSGIGIEKKDIPKLFDRFFRVDSVRTRGGYKGFGLGLAIAKKIIDTHNGTITVASIRNQGSTFTLHLPLRHKK